VPATIQQQAETGAAPSLTHVARHSGGPVGAACVAPSPVNGGRHRELREVRTTDQAIRATLPAPPRRLALPAPVARPVPDIGRQGGSHG
jgi:hypothetical protein